MIRPRCRSTSTRSRRCATRAAARCRRSCDAVRVCVDAGAPASPSIRAPTSGTSRRCDVPAIARVPRAAARARSSSTSRGIRGPICSTMVREVRPHQCTLVPVRARRDHQPGGLAARHAGRRSCGGVVADLQARGIRVSLFVEPEPAAGEVGGVARRAAHRALHRAVRARVQGRARTRPTRSFRPLRRSGQPRARARPRHQRRATTSTSTTWSLFRTLPHLDEVSIGHALISHALYVGLDRAVRDYSATPAHSPDRCLTQTRGRWA